jgi:hypothetical protein
MLSGEIAEEAMHYSGQDQPRWPVFYGARQFLSGNVAMSEALSHPSLDK